MPPLLSMEGMTKRYPGALALDNVSLTLERGEVLALVGENGAGKSTLVNILAGALKADAGSVTLEGAPVRFTSPTDALRSGVGVIYQDMRLVSELTVAENIVLGHEPVSTGGILLHRDEMQRVAGEALARLGRVPDLMTRVGELTPAARQLVAIARALSHRVKLLALDEPTAPLTGHETDRLFDVVRRLQREGVGIMYISHRLEEIFRIASRIAVLRDGRLVHAGDASSLDRPALISLMVGRTMEQEFPPMESTPGELLLSADGLRSPVLEGVSFTLRRGEVLGLAGLAGSGRTSLARILFGAERPTGGTMTLAGRPYAPGSPGDAIARGVALLTEDRNRTGLVLSMNVRENITLPSLNAFRRGPFIDRPAERSAAERHARALQIKTPTVEQKVTSLSGGNRQKVLLARWLLRDASVILFDEPTTGVDVGARYEIYRSIGRLAGEGRGIMLISSDLPELLGTCHRIAVMRAGELAGILPRAEATPERIMELATREGAAHS